MEEFHKLSEDTKSPTAYYNHAAVLYESELYDDALQTINLALEKKEKECYRVLKIHICCLLEDFEEAEKQLEYLDCSKEENAKLKDFIMEKV